MTDLEKQWAEALREHAMRTGGLMVGDTVTFDGHTVRVVDYTDGQFKFELDR
jgi:hypothetical protein